jgi:hypothetical protein
VVGLPVEQEEAAEVSHRQRQDCQQMDMIAQSPRRTAARTMTQRTARRLNRVQQQHRPVRVEDKTQMRPDRIRPSHTADTVKEEAPQEEAGMMEMTATMTEEVTTLTTTIGADATQAGNKMDLPDWRKSWLKDKEKNPRGHRHCLTESYSLRRRREIPLGHRDYR